MSDNTTDGPDEDTDGPDVSSEPHDWHLFDAEENLEVRQASAAGEPNRWEVRRGPDGPVTVLDDAEFKALREDGPNPKGL